MAVVEVARKEAHKFSLGWFGVVCGALGFRVQPILFGLSPAPTFLFFCLCEFIFVFCFCFCCYCCRYCIFSFDVLMFKLLLACLSAFFLLFRFVGLARKAFWEPAVGSGSF